MSTLTEESRSLSSTSLSSIDPPRPNGGNVVVVTGVAGFIGSATARALLERGDTVIGIDEINDYYDVEKKYANLSELTQAFGEFRFKFYKGDFCDKPMIDKIFANERPNLVCHLGARAGVRPSIQNPFLYIHSNILGTTVLLEASVACQSVTNFVYASSSSVYGGSKNEVFRETDNISQPCSVYAATKATCELIASTYNHLYQLPVTGLRFFTVYGPNGRPDMAPLKFISNIYHGRPIEQYGDGSSERDYTYISDIVTGIVCALDRPQPTPAVFNLGNHRPVSLTEFIKTVESLVGRKAVITQLPDQPGDVPRTCADTSLARKHLGYEPKTSLREGLRKTVEWYVSTQSKATRPTPKPMPALSDTKRACLALRIHRQNANRTNAAPDMTALTERVREATATSYAEIAIATDASDVPLVAAVKAVCDSSGATLVPVADWGNFVPALNALTRHALQHKCDFIAFQSTEVSVPSDVWLELEKHLDDDTLVVGAALEGHEFHVGSQQLNGTTTPWNTLALWDLQKLARTGFLMVSEGLFGGADQKGGVEEAAVIALHQKTFGKSRAKVIALKDVKWQTNFDDPKRCAWHKKKMESKLDRANAQLSALELNDWSIQVEHIAAY